MQFWGSVVGIVGLGRHAPEVAPQLLGHRYAGRGRAVIESVVLGNGQSEVHPDRGIRGVNGRPAVAAIVCHCREVLCAVMASDRYRARARQAAAGASQLPDLTPFLDTPHPDEPAPYTPPPRIEHPAIAERHPTWWQVHVLEMPRPGEPLPYAVLIAECRTETEAIAVMDREVWRTRLRKWGDRQRPYTTAQPLKPRP